MQIKKKQRLSCGFLACCYEVLPEDGPVRRGAGLRTPAGSSVPGGTRPGLPLPPGPHLQGLGIQAGLQRRLTSPSLQPSNV